MSGCAVRKSVYDGLNPVQKQIIRAGAAQLELGTAALFTAPGPVLWYVWDDTRFTLDDLAIIGAVAANLASLTNFVIDQGKPTHEQVVAWAQAHVVWPAQIDYTGQANPYQWTLTAQGAPATVQAAAAVPAGWVAS